MAFSKSESLFLKICWHLLTLGSRQGWGRLSYAGGTAPLLLSLAEEAGAEIPALLPHWQQPFLDEEQLFPQGGLFAHDVTWAVTHF